MVNIVHYYLKDPLSYFPQGGKVLLELLPLWGKVGQGVKRIREIS
jgi:hypothetical protein